jgi:hypothetical protein
VLDSETAIKAGRFVVAHGAPEEIARARQIIKTTGTIEVAEHHAVISAKQV